MDKIYIGAKYARLTVLKFLPNSKVECLCDCGNTHIVHRNHLRRGDIKSCGCLRKELRHGYSNTRLYHIWENMLQRTTNPNAYEYANYGGRGISVDARWRNFTGFLEWAKESYSPKLTIDRIDNDLDYSPENCRWATRVEQNNNTTKNRLVTCDNTTMTISSWSKHTGVNAKAITYRLQHGWEVHRALYEQTTRVTKSNGGASHRTTCVPVIQYNLNMQFIREWESMVDAARELGLSSACIGRCCKGKLKTSGGFVWKYKV